MYVGLWPDKSVFARQDAPGMISVLTNGPLISSCDGTFEQNCDSSRAYSNIADVRLISAVPLPSLRMARIALECTRRQ